MDRAEKLDLGVDGSASTVVEVSAESLEEPSEGRLDESATPVVGWFRFDGHLG
ncbi:hypothetical protein [Streptomyces sp. NBC_00233]|uniref:hypothetical protein n=1 Tax=Streptomyces sp. NBC_00233 TaxID=2975686 RepID=UPI00224CA364|nr:hypothetical protein [Streptomyces sp. NBC_00233]MCX5233214.1 hypothetical protein [Streptomyces sp. NBC_00233]